MTKSYTELNIVHVLICILNFNEFGLRNKRGESVPNLMVVEMKLKSGIWFGTKNDKIISFQCDGSEIDIDK